MASPRLEDLWTTTLASEGWSARARGQFRFAWADSTLATYNAAVSKLHAFGVKRGCEFPPSTIGALADFLCAIADSSDKPRSVLRNTQAALSHLYSSLRQEDLTLHSSVTLLVTSLVKSGTHLPMRHTPVMPVSYFVNMFRSWDTDDHLSVKMLRMKCIVLLALCLMLRPWDIAPRAAQFSPGQSGSRSALTFSEKQILFLEDGSAKVTFFGTKNDSQRTGFECHLQPHADP